MNLELVNSLVSLNRFAFERQDKFCELQLKISLLAAAIFATIGLVFHHFKSIDSMRLSFYLSGASLAIATLTLGLYIHIITSPKNEDKDSEKPAADRDEALKVKKEMLAAKTNWYENHADLFTTQATEKGFEIQQKKSKQAANALENEFTDAQFGRRTEPLILTITEGSLDLSGLDGVTDNVLETITKNPDLKSITLDGCKDVTAKGIKTVLNSLPGLVFLDVDSCGPWPEETSISFNKTPLISEESIMALLKCFPNLKSINLEQCSNPTNGLLQFICDDPALSRSVKALHLSGCPKIINEGFKDFDKLSQLTSLSTPVNLDLPGLLDCLKKCEATLVELQTSADYSKDLKLHYPPTDQKRSLLSEKSLASLVGQLPNLLMLIFAHSNFSSLCCEKLPPSTDHLSLEACPNVNDESLKIIAQRCPNLHVLAVCGNPITDAGLKHLATLKHLTQLHVSHTSISFEALSDLLQQCPEMRICRIHNTLLSKENVAELKIKYKNINFG